MIAGIVLGVGVIAFIYVLLTWLFSAMYIEPQRSSESETDVSIVMTTIARTDILDTLTETVEHHNELFPDLPQYIVVDEGTETIDRLRELDATVVVVPDEYSTNAIAKGRAQQYFIDTYVNSDEWYMFVDDDSRVCSRTVLHEIPMMGDEFAVANGYAKPRLGKSEIAFVLDHMRSLFDLFAFRATIGFLGKPYFGLHGEFMLVRGDCLQELGFNIEKSIVEDFVFAHSVIDSEYKTWMSDTQVSILSPNSLHGFLQQRRRWFKGKFAYYPKANRTQAGLSITVDCIWLLGIVGGYVLAAVLLWTAALLPAIVPLFGIVAAVVFTITYLVGIVRLARSKSVLYLLLVFAIPVIATFEHLAGWYALLTSVDGFEVIDKSM